MDWRARAAAALAVVILAANNAHADVRVNGDTRNVQVDVTQSNVAEVLSALETAFGLRINTSTALDRPVSGAFTGSLDRILSHILQGYNYFISHQETKIKVTIIGLQGNPAAAIARPLPTPAMSLSEAARLKRR